MPVQVIKSATFDAHVPNATAVTLTNLSRANGIYDLLTTGLNVTSKLTTVTADKKLVFVPKLVVDAPTLITVKTGSFAGTYRVKSCVFDGDKSIIEVFETPETFVGTNGLTDDVMITGLGFVKNTAPAFQTGTDFFYFSVKPNRMLDIVLEFKLNTCTLLGVVGNCTVNVQGKTAQVIGGVFSTTAAYRSSIRQFFKELVSDGNTLYYSNPSNAHSNPDISSGATLLYIRATLNGIILSGNAYYLENEITSTGNIQGVYYPPIAGVLTSTVGLNSASWVNRMFCLSDNTSGNGSSVSSGANYYYSCPSGSGVAGIGFKSIVSNRFKLSDFQTLYNYKIMNHTGSIMALERLPVITAGVTYSYGSKLVYCSEYTHYISNDSYNTNRLFSLDDKDWIR